MFRAITIFTLCLLSLSLYASDSLKSETTQQKLLAKVNDNLLSEIVKTNAAENKASNKKNKTNIDISHGYLANKPIEQNVHYKSSNLEIIVEDSKKIQNDDKILLDANIAYQLGQMEVATQLYKKVLATSSTNYNALFGLGTIYQANMQTDLARSLYTQLLTLYPDDEAALNNFIKLSGDESPSETIKELEKLESLKSDVALIPAQIAVIYSNMKNYDQAIRYIHKAIKLDPTNLNYRYNLAITYDKIELYEEAISLYSQVLKENFTNNDYNFNYDQIIKRINYLQNK